jgi:hypothetical protein
MCQQAIFGDTKTRGQARSPLLESYTRTVFRGINQKIPSELLPPAAADCAAGKIDAKNEDDEDDKLSTKPGQLHHIQSDKLGAMLFHGLPPVTFAENAATRSVCGSAHFGAQPTVMEADLFIQNMANRLALAGP